MKIFNTLSLALILALLISCSPIQPVEILITPLVETATPTPGVITPTPLPTRPVYDPGTLVDYTVQTGDTLPAVSIHFNTTLKEILEANPGLSEESTTLPPGSIIKVPIYYEALWGSPFQILPDSLFINGPAQVGFDTPEYVDSQPGWLKNYSAFAGEENRRGGALVDYVAESYSISPRLLLSIAEYQAGALSDPVMPEEVDRYLLGYRDQFHKSFYLQLVWAANSLNNGYYSWRSGRMDAIYRTDGSMEHPDPWQNAATIAIQYYFSLNTPVEEYSKAIYSEGLVKTYTALFGDPWGNTVDHIPGDLVQPEFSLPFVAGKTWTYTGGPHAAWGEGEPFAAIDFAPPAVVGGCGISTELVTAVADGQIVRSEPAVAILDLDGDGDERTGWTILYLHLGLENKVRMGTLVKQGDPIGNPSCEGGRATGTHVHIARKYNGEWILADGPLAFNLDGWISGNGSEAYMGTLKKFGRTVQACTCSNPESQITASNK